ncbi:hypothetical protein BC830DRAFT_1135658 [Chytriomyces sp. MP71]|nr:hypothetical protein BC830DRAFT_1135658 [Chytriomyces sp. MP71]
MLTILKHLIILLPYTLAYFHDSADYNFTFSASMDDVSSVRVCLQGIVTASQYIGLGIPYDANHPNMLGAELYVAFANSSGFVTLLHGKGVYLSDMLNFWSDTASSGSTAVTFDANGSSYNGTLVACFARPLQGQHSGYNISQGPSGYIWSTGPVDKFGYPRYHSMKGRGSIVGVSLFGGLTIANVPDRFAQANYPNAATKLGPLRASFLGLVAIIILS